ncbi:hypothetical protein K3495_g4786 [Podosphaera aphanis]|nr:hypothetical protein K3495_g4786 [Podosphaera aphanis]
MSESQNGAQNPVRIDRIATDSRETDRKSKFAKSVAKSISQAAELKTGYFTNRMYSDKNFYYSDDEPVEIKEKRACRNQFYCRFVHRGSNIHKTSNIDQIGKIKTKKSKISTSSIEEYNMQNSATINRFGGSLKQRVTMLDNQIEPVKKRPHSSEVEKDLEMLEKASRKEFTDRKKRALKVAGNHE